MYNYLEFSHCIKAIFPNLLKLIHSFILVYIELRFLKLMNKTVVCASITL